MANKVKKKTFPKDTHSRFNASSYLYCSINILRRLWTTFIVEIVRKLPPSKFKNNFLKKIDVNFPANLISIRDYFRRFNAQDKITFKDTWKGLKYLVKGFFDVDPEWNRNVYEKIAGMKRLPIIYISGIFEYPTNIRKMEEISGYEIAHFKERKDTKELQKLIMHTIKITGKKPIIIGYSDGGKAIHSYIKKYGMSKVRMFYILAGNKFNAPHPNKLVFIDALKDRLFIIEKGAFKKTSSDVFNVSGGHTWMCYDPLTIQQIFDIIKRTASI